MKAKLVLTAALALMSMSTFTQNADGRAVCLRYVIDMKTMKK